MLNNHRCYLFAFGIEPFEVGKIYDILPAHCTLIHRFWINLSPKELTKEIRETYINHPPIIFKIGTRSLLGPKNTPVYLLDNTKLLKSLHSALYMDLIRLGAKYTEPKWVGEGYTPHISERRNLQLSQGQEILPNNVYLIEVKIPGLPHKRVVHNTIR